MHKSDESFPLDGSQWNRLVRMRLKREHDLVSSGPRKENNFLNLLHSDGGPLPRERMSARKAMRYWFSTDSRYNAIGALFHAADTTLEKAIRALEEGNVKSMTLADAEAEWLQKRQKAWGTAVNVEEADHLGNEEQVVLDTPDTVGEIAGGYAHEVMQCPVFEPEPPHPVASPIIVDRTGIAELPAKV